MRFYDIPTPIEQKLFTMLMDQRMRTFQGAFHTNPDYTLWHGWAELKKYLVKIKEDAEEIRSRSNSLEKKE